MCKQAVESTDVFLGMGGKDESSTSCEDLVVKILLPEVSAISGGAGMGGRWLRRWARLLLVAPLSQLRGGIPTELDLDVKPTYIKLNSTK